jgi:hypothetical protein
MQVAGYGNDTEGVIQLTPGGTGITTGTQLTVTFAAARSTGNYAVLLTPMSSAARTAGWNVGPASRTTTGWALTSGVALSSGSVYQWSYALFEPVP